jgi:hypothetical protein
MNMSKKLKTILLAVCAICMFILLLVLRGQNQAGNLSTGIGELDYGLIWFGRNGQFQAFEAGAANLYYDPANPSIIFIHGWMPDQVGAPPTLMVDFPIQEADDISTLDLAAAWIEAGWNIGVFYWHPFSDEEFVWDAEDKIWTTGGEVGMRYRDADGNYHTEGMPDVNITDMLLNDYLLAFKEFTGSEIRIAGHSLGNQLAVKLTAELVGRAQEGKISDHLIPARVALLDPFWSPFPKPYLDGMETGEVIQQLIEQKILPSGILVEWYHSSLLTESTMIRDGIPNLKAQVLYAELDPRFCDVLDPICKHDGAWHIYLLSFESSAPPECIPDEVASSCEPTGDFGPMASTSNRRIAEMMDLPFYWVQDIGPDGSDGRYTPQTDDDWYHQLKNSSEME